jgi:hypothetical protein
MDLKIYIQRYAAHAWSLALKSAIAAFAASSAAARGPSMSAIIQTRSVANCASAKLGTKAGPKLFQHANV